MNGIGGEAIKEIGRADAGKRLPGLRDQNPDDPGPHRLLQKPHQSIQGRGKWGLPDLEPTAEVRGHSSPISPINAGHSAVEGLASNLKEALFLEAEVAFSRLLYRFIRQHANARSD